MIKFKLIAMGDVSGGDERVNEWLQKNQNIEIVSTNTAWDGDSLMYCILYKDKEEEIPIRMRKQN